MSPDHVVGLLLGASLALSALSFLIWALAGGLLSKTEETKEKAYLAESPTLPSDYRRKKEPKSE